MVSKISKKRVLKKLEDVIDPELYISIVDLGLVYDVKIVDSNVDVVMTLTTLGCPLFSLIETNIKDKVREIKGVKKVHVELVFDPPWNMDNMTERGKAMLGI